MSWITDSNLKWPHLIFLKLLKCGTIPKHVAFIMDGNRRFARKNNVRKIEGHTKGFEKLSETLQWCLDVGVEIVTVYAFSIENFKRSEEEVNDLLELTREKLRRLLEEKEKLTERGIKIRIIGNLSLLPPDIIKLIAEAELITKDNSKAILNVAFSYTAQDEMTQSISQIVNGLKSGSLDESDVNMALFENCLYTRSIPPPELIIRTSGETRLSDFLLCQGSFSYLHFTGVLWPELTAWDFLWAIFKYQMFANDLKKAREESSSNSDLTINGLKFIEQIDKNHYRNMELALQS